MRIDLHVHTSALSYDSNVAPEELVQLAQERGLDGLVLTEHDKIWDWDELALLSRAAKFPVLPAVEVTTDLGHILVFGLRDLPRGHHSARTLREVCDGEGALMYLAHPARSGSVRIKPDEMTTLFDGVEGVNGSDGALHNQASARAGSACRLPAIGGSDTHARHEVGLAATTFETAIQTMDDLLEALRSGRYQGGSL